MLNPEVKKQERVVRLMARAIRHVIQGSSWETAFQQTGISGTNAGVSTHILRDLQIDVVPTVSLAGPSEEDVKARWPRNRPFTGHLVMSCIPPASPPLRRLRWQTKPAPEVYSVALPKGTKLQLP